MSQADWLVQNAFLLAGHLLGFDFVQNDVQEIDFIEEFPLHVETGHTAQNRTFSE